MAAAASAAEAAPLLRGLLDEVVIWEILARLPPKSVLRCRAVCRAWRRATSTRSFLLAHHDHQPNLPVIIDDRNFLALDHRAAAAANDEDQIHTVARLDDVFYPEASCDGLLVLVRYIGGTRCFSIYNPATREHAPLGTGAGLSITGMYPHRPTGEYRLLLHRRTEIRWMLTDLLPRGHIGCYVFSLGSHLPPRYVEWPETTPPCMSRPALLHDNLHWYPSPRQAVIVFNTIAETFRWMRAPIAPNGSSVFEMDGTLGIYNRNRETETVDIWVL